jgi:glycosyltransferase involved in cell wall biosynthesis
MTKICVMHTSKITNIRLLIVWAESVNRNMGGSGHFWGLLEGLESVGCNVRAICPRYGCVTVPDAISVSYVRLPQRSLLSFLLFQVWLLVIVPYHMLRHRPHVIYQRTWFLSFLMRPLLRLARIRLVMEIDAIVEEETKMRGQCNLLGAAVRFAERLSFRFADGLICVTEGIRNEVIRRGAEPQKTQVVHNAARVAHAPLPDQYAARQCLGLPLHGRIVGFAGTFAPWQGLDMLVDVAPDIVRGCPECVYFVLMGEGQHEDDLRQRVAAMGLNERFIFLPPADHEIAAVLYSACDVIVIPIYDERKLRYGISPLKFWDALSAGVPVIVPRHSELDGFLDRVSLPGTFVPGNREDFTHTVLTALRSSQAHLARRAEVHRIVQEEYSWINAARKVLAFSASLCDSFLV